MPPLTDPERRRHYLEALRSWECSGCIRFTQRAAEWVYAELGLTSREFSRLMWEHVKAGGTISEVKETRHEYLHAHDFHHDMRFAVARRKIYVETRLLMESDIEDTEVFVVNVHDA